MGPMERCDLMGDDTDRRLAALEEQVHKLSVSADVRQDMINARVDRILESLGRLERALDTLGSKTSRIDWQVFNDSFNTGRGG